MKEISTYYPKFLTLTAQSQNLLTIQTKLCISSHAWSRKHHLLVMFAGQFDVYGVLSTELHVTLLIPRICRWLLEFGTLVNL